MCVEINTEDLTALNRLQSTKDTVPWWHVFHRWTRWEVCYKPMLGGGHAWQSRACVRCGREQRVNTS